MCSPEDSLTFKWYCLSHNSDPPWILVHGHTAPYLNESSTKGLRVYSPSFGSSSKFQNPIAILPHYYALHTSLGLIISKAL